MSAGRRTPSHVHGAVRTAPGPTSRRSRRAARARPATAATSRSTAAMPRDQEQRPPPALLPRGRPGPVGVVGRRPAPRPGRRWRSPTSPRRGRHPGSSPSIPIRLSRSLSWTRASAAWRTASIALRSASASVEAPTMSPAWNCCWIVGGSCIDPRSASDSTARALREHGPRVGHLLHGGVELSTSGGRRGCARGSCQSPASASVRRSRRRASARASSSAASSGRTTHLRHRSVKSLPVSRLEQVEQAAPVGRAVDGLGLGRCRRRWDRAAAGRRRSAPPPPPTRAAARRSPARSAIARASARDAA